MTDEARNEDGGAADLPIIFSGPMVRAIIDDRKTMTRRLAWRGTMEPRVGAAMLPIKKPSPWQRVKPGDRLFVRENIWQASPYPGTLPSGEPDESTKWSSRLVHYAADGNPPNCANRHYGPDGLRNGAFAAPDPYAVWLQRPSIHMPRWASRLTLLVTATKIERLQEISEEDARAEGCEAVAERVRHFWSGYDARLKDADGNMPHVSIFTENAPDWMELSHKGTLRDKAVPAKNSFMHLWRSLHGADAWGANPEVVARSFRVIKSNIDHLPREAA